MRDEAPASLREPETREGWFFDIHEDTEEELATNLMEHSTCTLDISSDEESVRRARDSRGKENVPPVDDVSQTRFSGPTGEAGRTESEMGTLKANCPRRRRRDEDACDIDRLPLGEMKAEDFYAEGCDGESVFLVPGESDPTGDEAARELEQIPTTFDFLAEVKGKGKEVEMDVEGLMAKDHFAVAPQAALLEPIEKAEEGFEVWVRP